MSYKLSTIFSNTFAQLVAKFFGAGLTLITTFYTIRLAGLDLYGDLTKILVLVAVGFTAIDFGLNAEGIRSSHNKEEMRKKLYYIILARGFLSLFAVVGLNILIFALPGGYSGELRSIFWLGSLAIIFQGIYASGNVWFQYNLSYWKSTISVVIGSLIGASITLYYLNYSPTLFHLVLANSLGYLVMAICSICLLPLDLRSLRDFIKTTGTLKTIILLLRRSFVLGLIIIASVIASKVDTIILGVYRLSSEVGQYGFAYRIFDVILVLPIFVMNVIYPLWVEENNKKSNSRLISGTAWSLAVVGLCVTVILYFAAPLIYLVKPDMGLSVSVLRILAISLPLFYITAPLMWGLIGKHKDHTVLWIYIFGALINTILNLLFVPSHGAVAAAINTGITEGFLVCALLYFSHAATLKH